MIQTMKSLLLETAKEQDINDEEAKHYIGLATTIIKRYCNIEELSEDINPAVVELAMYLYLNKENYTGIPKYIKELLPYPRIKIIG